MITGENTRMRYVGGLFIIAVTALILEASSRLIISKRWPAERRYAMTHHTSVRGRLSSHPFLPYVLNPDFHDKDSGFSHNTYGFRGKEFEVVKPEGRRRIVCLGSSTTYCIFVRDGNTYPDRLEALLEQNGFGPVEVLNAGVPGWTSMEVLLNFQMRVLNLSPDMVIVYEGRNEVFPQAFNDFRSDYSHYREVDYSFRYSNYLFKPLFRISNFSMLLMHGVVSYFGPEALGWSEIQENPMYGTINYANRPTVEQLRLNLAQPERNWTYRNNIETILRLCQAGNITVVTSSLAFLKDKYSSGVIPRKMADLSAIEMQIQENNGIVRELAQQYGATFVDCAAELSRQELLADDCHFNAEGEMARAQLIYKHIAPLLQ
jgi:lysophospholipase L1-like esterase